jgi:hypothetical protein
MYGNMKALRMLKIVKLDANNQPGINGGLLHYKGNFPPGTTHLPNNITTNDGDQPYDWESKYSDIVLNDMIVEGGIGHWDQYWLPDKRYKDKEVSTAFALLLLSESVFDYVKLKGELITDPIIRQACSH